MRITKRMLKWRFKKFNEKYFKGELTEPEFRINGSRDYAGLFSCKLMWKPSLDGDYYDMYLTKIRIDLSKYLLRNPSELDDILLHEMIHYYGFYLSEDLEGSHGKFFMKHAKKINKDGYHIDKVYEFY